MRRLDELTSADVRRMKRKPVVLLPVGAVEQHGAHLPLGADLIQPMHVLQRVAARTGAILAPPIPYGYLRKWRALPGSLSVSRRALSTYVRDVLSELARNGFTRIVVVSGHAEKAHLAALRRAAEGVKARVTVLSDYEPVYAKFGVAGEGHAGKLETSRLLAQRPDLVRRPRPGVGVTGDPRAASAALGRRIDRHVEAELIRFVTSGSRRRRSATAGTRRYR